MLGLNDHIYYKKLTSYVSKYYDLIGGADDLFYLPSELTHYTTHLYYGSLLTIHNPTINELIGPTADDFNVRYYQDPFIQLFNASNNKYLDLFNSALISIYRKKMLCASERCEYEPRFNNSDPSQNKIFNLNHEISLPYGYKLKSGSIREAEYYSGPPSLTNDDKFVIRIVDNTPEEIAYREQSKGGNFISAPMGTNPTKSYIFAIKGAKPELLDKIRSYPLTDLTELRCSFKSNGFRHIDELMCFMPYGKTDRGHKIFKVWFYDELDAYSFNNLKIRNTHLNITDRSFGSLEPELKRSYLALLNTERMHNLNLISNKLFGSDYASNTDKFVFFKLYLNSVSIFNRVWIEKPNQTICLFGQNLASVITNRDQINANTDRVKSECTSLKSWVNQTHPIVFKWLETPTSDENKPEGGVHCMIKQRFNIVLAD